MSQTRPVPDAAAPGQESVWAYPRPPRVAPTDELVQVRLGGFQVASSTGALRVLETSHPPTYYLPIVDFTDGALRHAPDSSWCEFKGAATYFDVIGGGVTARSSAWTYSDPAPGFEAIVGFVAVMPAAMDECRVDDEVVRPQEGGFYGGWITSRVVGPFKGGPGSRFW